MPRTARGHYGPFSKNVEVPELVFDGRELTPGGSVYETRGTETCRRRPPLLRSASCVRTSSECKHRRVGRSSASCDECIPESKTTLAGLRDISGSRAGDNRRPCRGAGRLGKSERGYSGARVHGRTRQARRL